MNERQVTALADGRRVASSPEMREQRVDPDLTRPDLDEHAPTPRSTHPCGASRPTPAQEGLYGESRLSEASQAIMAPQESPAKCRPGYT
jgi:hypothetical protein